LRRRTSDARTQRPALVSGVRRWLARCTTPLRGRQSALAALVIEAAEPASLRLRDTQAQTRALRERLSEGDRTLARLERAFATLVDRAPGAAP